MRNGGAPAVEVAVVDTTHGAGVRPAALARWLERIIPSAAPGGGSLHLLLTSDRRLAELNRRYRKRRGPTDVLSFPGDGAPDDGASGDGASGDGAPDDGAPGGGEEAGAPPHLGDVAISVPAARRQARCAAHPLGRELRLLALHGLLHCLGHDHETDDGTMERLERRLRRRWLDADA